MLKLLSIGRNIGYQFSKVNKKKIKDIETQYNITEALKMVKTNSRKTFDETIDIQLKLNVDPKRGDQAVRGTCIMPGGLGKKIKIAVLVSENQVDIAKNAGADFYDPKEIITMLKENKYLFEKLIATAEVMSQLKGYARQLGPKGLMPNLKAGTLISSDSLEQSIKSAKAGQIEFRVDSGKNLMAPVGKVSFQDEVVLENINAFANILATKRPSTIKGSFISQASLKTTMGKRVRLDVHEFDFKGNQSN